jgi:hypothetical protein
MPDLIGHLLLEKKRKKTWTLFYVFHKPVIF